MKYSIVFAGIWMLIGQKSVAHVLGDAAWCRTNNPFHFECFFTDEASCQRYNKMTKDPFEEWSCDTQPTDPEIRNAKDPKILNKQKK